MSLILDSLPEFFGALGSACVAAGGAWGIRWAVRRRDARLRRYTLLGTVAADGNPVQHTTTHPAGASVTVNVNGAQEAFELTDVQLEDGTYAAEPVHRLRRYTLLGTVAADGNPVQHPTTRPAGTTITREINGVRERFELTNALLHDGTYAAEPMDLYV